MAETTGPAPDEASIRQYLVDNLSKDLLGPHEIDEKIKDPPTIHYLTGILYPQGIGVEPAEDDFHNDFLFDEETDDSEVLPSPSESLRPSSIGLTCEIDDATQALDVMVNYGTYSRKNSTGHNREWDRTPREFKMRLDISTNRGEQDIAKTVRITWDVKGRLKRRSKVLTFFLINTAKFKRKVLVESCIFQPVISLRGVDGARPFVQRAYQVFPGAAAESEAESYELLFRDKREFAVGHGCSVAWEEGPDNRTARIWTEIIPRHEIPRLDAFTFEMEGLDMRRLAEETTPAGMRQLLSPLTEKYQEWIDKIESDISKLDLRFQSTAKGHLDRCRETASRIEEGINLVCSSRDALEAFRFANQAMNLQLSRIPWILDFRRTGSRKALKSTDVAWRPFQLAFILLNLRGITDPDSSDRKIVDLLWFPTGGGKTEAYLGLAAFVMSHRRLRASSSDRVGAGVAIIMRYTLRLLTIQQFQRAAMLLCACEIIRRQNTARWGKEPFLIGLWVGLTATPNTFEQGVEALTQHQAGNIVFSTPVQLHYCPWCGESITAKDFWADNARQWILVSCPRLGCDFSGKRVETALPVLTVDEDIYRRCPALLVSTVDKFARIAWNYRTAAIFGRIVGFCPVHGYIPSAEGHPSTHTKGLKSEPVQVMDLAGLPPPELIIQDELHLITGPLGTMVGLYETVIDYLCCYREKDSTVFPKVIASTATIRRAGEQINRLFTRQTSQFPPPGIDAGDSFFAKEKPLQDVPGRLYVGVCAPGRSVKYALVWIYASLLQYAAFHNGNIKAVDPYWTLVGYFNSLRELGGAIRLTEDDIPGRMDLIAGSKGRREIEDKEELTSRVGSYTIPDILSRLELNVGSGQAIDLLIATNMLSAGVDIQRLGLMVVNGQPKGTSEYLQATSRIGRRAPGLVVTLYNPYRPRDISHYERFVPYHSMLYRHVDAVSVTPFAHRARDRGLRALIIALARAVDWTLMPNSGAGRFDRSLPVVNEIRNVIKSRMTAVEPREIGELDREIDSAFDTWEDLVAKYRGDLVYQLPPYQDRPDLHQLLKRADETEPLEAWKTPDSLRNVEKMANLYYRSS